MERRFNQPNSSNYHLYSDSYCDEYPPPSYQDQREAAQAQEREQEETEQEGKGAMSWFNRVTGSREFQFGATALVSGAVVAGAILGYQHVRRQEKIEDLKSSIPALGEGHLGDRVCLISLCFRCGRLGLGVVKGGTTRARREGRGNGLERGMC